MKVTFADQRPQGSFALAIPVRGEDMLTQRLSGLDDASRRILTAPVAVTMSACSS